MKIGNVKFLAVSAILSAFAVSAAAQPGPWDLSLADYEISANFGKQIVFSDTVPGAISPAIVRDLVYPAGAPAATVNIHLTEFGGNADMNIEWLNVTIVSGGNTFSLNPTNGAGAMCGPAIQPSRQLPGGGTLVIDDSAVMKLSVSNMPLGPTLQIRLSGRVIGTGPIKGSYDLSVQRIPSP